MGFITSWYSKCFPQPGVGPASGFVLICENTILWQSITSYLQRLPLVFTKGKKKKLFSAKPQESCCSASAHALFQQPQTHLRHHRAPAAHLQKGTAALRQAQLGWESQKPKVQSSLCHLLYCRHSVLIKGPSQRWMSSLAGSTDVGYPVTASSWNTPTELHSHQPAQGGEMQSSSFPISLSHHAPRSIKRNPNASCSLWGLFTSHNGFWQLRQQGTVGWHSCCLPGNKGSQRGKKTLCWHMLTYAEGTTFPENQAAFTHQRTQPDSSPLKSTVHRPQCHLQPRLQWHPQSLSSPGVAQHPSTGMSTWSLPATPDRAGLQGCLQW